MKYKYNQKLPKKVENQLDVYIQRIKAIKWFQPQKDLDFSKIDKQVNLVLEAFGVKASIEYRKLKTVKDWNAAWDAAWDAAWNVSRNVSRSAAWNAAWSAARNAARDAAWSAARNATWDATWNATRNAARNATRNAAWDVAWGVADVLALNLQDYKKKYPKGNFINLIPLYEAGLYPIGIVKGKFIVYVPEKK